MNVHIGLEDAYRLFHDGILALARMERQGIRLDVEVAKAKEKQLSLEIEELAESFKATKFFQDWQKSQGLKSVNIFSDLQLRDYVYGAKKMKVSKTTKSGKGSTDVEALAALGITDLDILLRIRKLTKLRDTYLNGFISEEVKGFIHPVFNLHTVSTYRSSSDSPNFQNIPVRDKESKALIRQCLFPREGHQLLEVDFSGLEVCIAACYHKDPTMINYIKDPATDMHRDMAQQIFFIKKFDKKVPAHSLLRSGSKNGFVFPQFYGDYYVNNAASLSKWAELPTSGKYKSDSGIELMEGVHLGQHMIDNGIRGMSEFTEHLKKIENHFWKKRFPVYDRWKKTQWETYQKNGRFLSYTGFEFRGVFNRKEVTNYPVQGSAFHCLLWCLIELDKKMMKRGWKTRLIGQIHDSLILDVHPSELSMIIETIKKVTEVDLPKNWDWINVPLKIDAELCGVDQSWFYKEEIEIH
jgi:DNA polymerase-1